MFKVSKEKLQQILSSGLTQNPQDSMVEFNSTKCFEDSLKCNIKQGLNDNDIRQRQLVFGINEKESLVSISFFKALCIILLKPQSIFFLTLSLIAFILKYLSTKGIYTNEWIESLVIFGLISLNLIISTIHLKIADNDKKKLLIQDEQSKSVKVLRNGQEQSIIARDLVVGDIVILQENDKLYVDGLIVEQNDLEINESFLTGEQDSIHKITLEEAIQQKQPILPQKHLVFAESQVIKGSAKLLVLGVGIEIQANKISILIKQEDNKTIILSMIENISSKMETIGFVGAIVVIFMLLARYMVQYHDSNVNGYSTFSNILNLIIVLISGNASKALITHFQFQLAQTVNLMLYSQNLVRKLSQLENLPFMDSLLFDKTGTLTQNRMCLDTIINDTREELTQSRFNHFPQEFQQAFIDSCFINNEFDPENDQGTPIDKALFRLAQEMRINLEERKKQVTHKIPFNSSRKRLTSIINNNRVVVRGGAEIIFQQATKFYSLKNGVVAIDDFLRDCLEQQLIQLSQEGRTVTIAYTDDVNLKNENIDELIKNNKFEFDRQNLTLLGFLLFNDPLRIETKMTVEGLKQAGVKVVMITGDNSVNAKSVAIKAGIMSLDSIITEGVEFTQKLQNKKENLQKDIEDIYVMCRARPEDKYNLVKELQELGHVVGVCGDGTNDAPALSKSDVGYSLGIAGTEIARESSGIILLDDNIHSVYKGLILARNLLDSIKRLAQYQITSHFSLIIILIASSAIGDAVISPLQFIWINLITDIFATFALSYCTPSSYLYHQKPLHKNEFLLDIIIYIHIIILAIYIITVCIIFVNQSLMVFNLFVMITLFNLINSRMVYLEFNVFSGFFRSWMIYTSILIIGLLQFLIVEYGGIIMQTFNGLSLKQWLICIAIGIGSIIWRTIAILIIRPIIKSDKRKLKVS